MNTCLRIFLLAGISAALVVSVAAQNGQNLRVTNGPILESVSADSAVVAWSTNVDGSTKVF